MPWQLFGYGRNDWSTKLIRGLTSETRAGFQSRRGLRHDTAPVAPHYAAFPTYKTPPIHDAARRCGGGVAGGGAGAAASMPVVGFLSTVSPVGFEPRLQAFRQGLKDLGYVEGENVAIEYRWAEKKSIAPGARSRSGSPAGLRDSRERRTAGAIAAKALDTKIPIVFGIPEDPVKFGLVTNLGRPGGNMTGVNFFVGGNLAKRLELLSELVPKAERVAVFINPSNAERAATQAKELEDAARAMRLQTRIYNTGSGRDIEAAFTTLARDRPDALFVSADPIFVTRRVQLADLASRHALPSSFSCERLSTPAA